MKTHKTPMYKDISATFRVTFSRPSCEGRGVRGGRAPKKPARSRSPRPMELRQRKRESLNMRVDGSAPMRRGLVLARSFFMPPAVPAHPSTRKPHAGGKASGACPPGASPTGCRMRADFPKPCPPLYGESGARRLRPRAHCLCGVAPCSGASAGRLAASWQRVGGLMCARAHGHCFG